MRISLDHVLLMLIALTVVLIPSIFTITHSSEEDNLRMAVEFNDHSAAAWVAIDKGIFEELGLNVTYLETFRTGLELSAAMMRGDVDVAWACLGPVIMAYSNGLPIKVVAGTHLQGYAIVARSEFEEPSQLDGGVLACPGKGSPCYLLLKLFVERHGLNYTLMYLRPDLAVNALITGQIDAAALPEHYVTLAVRRGECRVLAQSQDLWPNMPGSVLVVREDLIEEKPELVSKLVQATIKATCLIEDDFEGSASVVASRLGLTLDEALESMSHLEYDVKVDLAEYQRYIDLMAQYGCIPQSFNASNLVDLSFLGESS